MRNFYGWLPVSGAGLQQGFVRVPTRDKTV